MIVLCAQHANPYPPETRGGGPPPEPRVVRWYRTYWPIITSVTAFVAGIVLMGADLVQDWTVAPTAMPAYATLFAIAGVGLSLGKRA